MVKLDQWRACPSGRAFFAHNKTEARTFGARLASPAQGTPVQRRARRWPWVAIATPNREAAVTALCAAGYAPSQLEHVQVDVSGPYPTHVPCPGLRLQAPSRTTAARWAGVRTCAVHAVRQDGPQTGVYVVVAQESPYDDTTTVVAAFTSYEAAVAAAAAHQHDCKVTRVPFTA